jgi:branched-chain amino acid transport system ATP-binding protein
MSATTQTLRARVPDDRRPVLEVDGLTVRFGGNTAVDGFSLTLRQRERVGLIGPNGAGKSTCVNAITGYVRSQGSVVVDGVSLQGASPQRRSRAGMVRTFQNLELFLSMTVAENVAFGADGSRTGSEQRADLRRTLELLHLDGLHDRPVSSLAYGTRKLVELGRALVGSPRLLLLDEPMAGLDTGEKAEFVEVLDGIFAELESAVLLIEHDMFAVEQLTETVYVLDAGSLIASGPFHEVARQQAVIDAYLGA